jgi:hypothetical protein
MLKSYLQEQVVEDTFKSRGKSRCNCCSKFRLTAGIFNWWRILWNLNDTKLVELNGADYTLYLVFMRYAACFFVAISAFGMIVMAPVYNAGEPRPVKITGDETLTIMNKITILNITDNILSL